MEAHLNTHVLLLPTPTFYLGTGVLGRMAPRWPFFTSPSFSSRRSTTAAPSALTVRDVSSSRASQIMSPLPQFWLTRDPRFSLPRQPQLELRPGRPCQLDGVWRRVTLCALDEAGRHLLRWSVVNLQDPSTVIHFQQHIARLPTSDTHARPGSGHPGRRLSQACHDHSRKQL
jgi:hypothetical protein